MKPGEVFLLGIPGLRVLAPPKIAVALIANARANLAACTERGHGYIWAPSAANDNRYLR